MYPIKFVNLFNSCATEILLRVHVAFLQILIVTLLLSNYITKNVYDVFIQAAKVARGFVLHYTVRCLWHDVVFATSKHVFL